MSLCDFLWGESLRKYKNRYQIIRKCRCSRSVKCSAGTGWQRKCWYALDKNSALVFLAVSLFYLLWQRTDYLYLWECVSKMEVKLSRQLILEKISLISLTKLFNTWNSERTHILNANAILNFLMGWVVENIHCSVSVSFSED